MRSLITIVAALLVGLFVADVAEARGPVLGQRRAFRQGVRQGARAAGFNVGFNRGFNRSAFRNNNVNVNIFGSPFGRFNSFGFNSGFNGYSFNSGFGFRRVVIVNTFPSAFFGYQTLQLGNGVITSVQTNERYVPGAFVELDAFGSMIYP